MQLNYSTSKFFITYAKQSSLDTKYTIIGRVIDGADDGALDLMEKVPVTGKASRPVTEIGLTSVTVHANPVRQVPLV